MQTAKILLENFGGSFMHKLFWNIITKQWLLQVISILTVPFFSMHIQITWQHKQPKPTTDLWVYIVLIFEHLIRIYFWYFVDGIDNIVIMEIFQACECPA